MKHRTGLGRLITTSALTLGLLAGSAQTASAQAISAASRPRGGDFIIGSCNQANPNNIQVSQASGGSVISQPNCSRDTIIRIGR